MGWNSQAVVANKVIVQGTDDGVFVYSGTPAFGNLIVSAASQAGNDPYGNPYPEGINVTAGTISGVTVTSSNANGTIFITGNEIQFGSGAFIEDAPGGLLKIGSVVAPPPLDIALPLSAPLQATHPGVTSVETWQPVTSLPTGWTAIGAGVRYRLMTDNSVRFQISASISAAASSGTVNLVTLGTGYIPQNPFRGCAPGLFTNAGSYANALYNSRFQVAASGVVSILGFPGGGATGLTEIDGQWDIPLD